MRKLSYFYMITVSIFYLVCCIYVYFTCTKHNKLGEISSFFRRDYGETLKQFMIFQQKSVEFLKEYSKEQHLTSKPPSTLPNSLKDSSLCITIPSVSRKFKYLTVLVSSLLQSDPSIFRKIAIKISNKEQTEADNPDFQYVKSLLQNNEMFEFIPSLKQEEIELTKNMTWETKQIYDHLQCMKLCEGYTYVLFLEDDAYATKNVFEKIKTRVIEKLENKDWFLSKLFVFDFYDGFDAKGHIYCSVGITTSAFYHLLVILNLYYYSRRVGWNISIFGRKRKDDSTISTKSKSYFRTGVCVVVLFLLFVVLSEVFFMLSLNKQFVIPRKNGTRSLNKLEKEMRRPGTWIGAQSQLFNSKYVFPCLIEHLERVLEEEEAPRAIDIQMKYYMEDKWFVAIPSLFQHVGFSSSKKIKNQKFLNLKQSLSFVDGPWGFNYW